MPEAARRRDLVGVALGEAVELFVPRQAAEPGGGTVLVDGLHHVAGDAAARGARRRARGRREGQRDHRDQGRGDPPPPRQPAPREEVDAPGVAVDGRAGWWGEVS